MMKIIITINIVIITIVTIIIIIIIMIIMTMKIVNKIKNCLQDQNIHLPFKSGNRHLIQPEKKGKGNWMKEIRLKRKNKKWFKARFHRRKQKKEKKMEEEKMKEDSQLTFPVRMR